MEYIVQILPLLIPIIALLIPLIIVSSYFVVQPLAKAITSLTEATGGGQAVTSGPELTELEARVASLEQVLERVLEEQSFQRELRSGPAVDPAPVAGDSDGQSSAGS